MKLNEQQEVAANHRNGAACVVAGPGSGKTRTVIERVRRLLDEGVKPEEILMITFTVKAAKEMRERLSEYYDTKDMLILTFHAFCLRVLNRFSPKKFGVMDEDEASLFFWKIAKEKGKDGSYYRNILKLKESGVSVEAFKEQSQFDVIMKDLWRDYEEAKKSELLFDYQDLQINFIKAATKSEGIQNYLKTFRYVSIDEFQDTSEVQMKISKILHFFSDGNIFCVGDPKQSIYKFRGAVVGNILNFKTHFPGAVEYDLSVNYRSGKDIVKHSNLLISRNEEGRRNISSAAKSEDGTVTHIEFDTDREEKKFICEMIPTHVQDAETVAILCRTRAVAEEYERLLKLNKSPSKKINFKKMKILASLYDSLDDISFGNFLKLDMVASTYKNLKDNNPSLLSSTESSSLKAVSSKTKEVVSDNLKFAKELRDKNADEFIRFISKDEPDNEERIVSVAEGLYQNGMSMVELISSTEEYILETDESKMVHVMTCHKAKGLEFDVVYIPNFNQGYMPMGNDVEEERRLAFVAYTRAKNKLIITSHYRDLNKNFEQRVSVFVKEARI